MRHVPEPLRVQVPAHKHFGLGIGSPYPAHIVAAGGGGVYVHLEHKIRKKNKE